MCHFQWNANVTTLKLDVIWFSETSQLLRIWRPLYAINFLKRITFITLPPFIIWFTRKMQRRKSCVSILLFLCVCACMCSLHPCFQPASHSFHFLRHFSYSLSWIMRNFWRVFTFEFLCFLSKFIASEMYFTEKVIIENLHGFTSSADWSYVSARSFHD